jgi:hypothetical protein
MSKYTPETLRRDVDDIRQHPERAHLENRLRRLDAHADAWEMREMALRAALEENTCLYRTLEAAEKRLGWAEADRAGLLADITGILGTYAGNLHPRVAQALEATAREYTTRRRPRGGEGR